MSKLWYQFRVLAGVVLLFLAVLVLPLRSKELQLLHDAIKKFPRDA